MSQENRDSKGMMTRPPKQKHFLTDSGKKVLLDEEMIALRNNIAQGLGYRLGPCSFSKCFPNKPPSTFLCWERGSHMAKVEGTSDEVEVASYHCVSGVNDKRMEADGELLWPDDVFKAAKAIDRNKRKPEPKAKPAESKQRSLLP